MLRAVVAGAVLLSSVHARAEETRGDVDADTSRFTLNAGFPELVGVGYGREVHGWRLQADAGVIILVNSLTLGIDRPLVRSRYVVLGVGAYGSGWWQPPLIGEYPESKTDLSAGARAFIEVGRPRDDLAFVLAVGGAYWRDAEDTFGRGASHLRPSFVVRIAINWPSD